LIDLKHHFVSFQQLVDSEAFDEDEELENDDREEEDADADADADSDLVKEDDDKRLDCEDKRKIGVDFEVKSELEVEIEDGNAGHSSLDGAGSELVGYDRIEKVEIVVIDGEGA